MDWCRGNSSVDQAGDPPVGIEVKYDMIVNSIERSLFSIVLEEVVLRSSTLAADLVLTS